MFYIPLNLSENVNWQFQISYFINTHIECLDIIEFVCVFSDLPFAIFTISISISIHLKNVSLIDSLQLLHGNYDNLNCYYNYLT